MIKVNHLTENIILAPKAEWYNIKNKGLFHISVKDFAIFFSSLK